MGKSRIALDVRKLGETGVGRYIENLLRGLAEQSSSAAYEWQLFGRQPNDGEALTVPPGTRWYPVRAPVYSLTQHTEFWQHTRHHRLDLLHAPHFTTPLLLPRRTRLIVTIHDVAFLERPDLVPAEHNRPWKRALYRLYLQLAAARAEVISVVTQAAGQTIERYLPAARGKTRVLYQGIALERFAPLLETPDLPGDSRDTLLFVGTITARKGVHELIRAFAGSRARREGLRLTLVGADRSAYALAARQLATSLGVADAVQFPGPISDQHLLAHFARARALVLPSHLEGFGIPVVEAMAAGVPCVASNIAPIQEVAGDAALLVPPGEVPALTQALDTACFDLDTRAHLITVGRQRAAYFSTARMGADALALYRDVLQGNWPPHR